MVSSSTGEARGVEADWSGAELSVAWTDRRDGNPEVYFNAIAAGALVCGSDVRITNHGEASITPTVSSVGTRHTLAWRDRREREEGAVSNIILTRAVNTSLCLTASEETELIWGDPNDPSIVAGEPMPVVFWSDARHVPDVEIYGVSVDCVASID
jgi:hypothetical protein